jgi:ubiquinone/menaquinone biosynthesis C-methylase UbiE
MSQAPRAQQQELSPRPLMRILGDFANSQILAASLEYDFFTLVHSGFHSAEEIAREADTHPRATRIVLDSLVALALVEKRDGLYYLAPISEAFLVRGKPPYIGDFRHVALALWDGMAHLKESLKSGKPSSRLDSADELKVWEKLVIGIIPIAEPAAKALCDILKLGSEWRGIRVLDIAGGSSIFGMTILFRDPSAEVTQLDWPNVNAIAKKLNQERGLNGKIRFVDGEHRSAAIEDNYYDLVVASNFCRFESPKGNQELFVKAHAALKPGGKFVVNDFLPNEERTGPTFALRFSVYTLTHTPEGECWTLSQYSDWLRRAGFANIESHTGIPNTLPGTTLIVAGKSSCT